MRDEREPERFFFISHRCRPHPCFWRFRKMQHRNFRMLLLSAVLVFGWSVAVFAQGTGEGTPVQRLEVMRSKLDLMRRSLNSALASMNAKESGDKKGQKADADDPSSRLRGLEKDVSSV